MPKPAEIASVASPRRPSPAEAEAVARRVQRWAGSTPNVVSADLFTHSERPTVRVAVVSRAREYDPDLDAAVTQLDLELAQDTATTGIDVELRLFFAAAPEQVAGWARGWERRTDA